MKLPHFLSSIAALLALAPSPADGQEFMVTQSFQIGQERAGQALAGAMTI